MWKLAILFQLSKIFGIETVVVGPRNTAVIAGQRMEMKCQVDSDEIVREWSIQRTLSSEMKALFTNWENRSRIPNAHFGVDVNDIGSVILYVNSTTLDDAGIYICTIHQRRIQPQKYSAHLIVFETEPLCSSNSTLPLQATHQEETYVWIRCTVNFRGNLVPNIEWRKHEGYGEQYEEGREITNLADTVIIPNSSITSELTVVFASNTSSLSNSFKIYFKPLNESQLTNATNAPNYSYTLRIPVVDISSTYLKTDRALIPMALAVSLVSASFVAVIIWCIRRRRRDIASLMRLDNIPDVANSQRESLSDPFYAEEPRTERAIVESKQGTTRTGSSLTEGYDDQNSRPLKYFDVDGTEYMEVNATGRQPMPVRLQTKPNIFSVVEVYASIDHTLSPPIPPRGKIL